MDTQNTEIESETALDEEESTPASEYSPADDRMSRKTITPEEALKLVKQGEMVTGVKIVGLVLKGVFSCPVHFKDVTLVQPQISNATFAESVEFEHTTIDRLRLNNSKFAKGLGFDGSTLFRAEIRRISVQGPSSCNNAPPPG